MYILKYDIILHQNFIDMDKDYLTPNDACKIFSVEYNTMWRWLKIEKILPFYQISPRKILIKKTDLEDFLESKRIDFKEMKNKVIS